MADKYKYTGCFTTKFNWTQWNEALSCSELCSIPYSKTFENDTLTAYAYSNVDAFGALALCYQKFNAGSTMSANIKDNHGDVWDKISADVIKQAAEVGNAGWISISTKQLIPTT